MTIVEIIVRGSVVSFFGDTVYIRDSGYQLLNSLLFL